MTNAGVLAIAARVKNNIANLNRLTTVMPYSKLTNIDLRIENFEVEHWYISRSWYRLGKGWSTATCQFLQQLYKSVELTDAFLGTQLDESSQQQRVEQSTSLHKSLYFLELLSQSYNGSLPELDQISKDFIISSS